MQNGAVRLLGLSPELSPRAARLTGLVFLSSLSLSLAKAAQSGIFLGAWTRADIPWAFAASALVLASLSTVSVALTPRLGITRLAPLTLLGAAALVLAMAVLPGGRPVAFATYVVIEAVSGLILVQTWGVVGTALDPRSAKRVLPIAGVGAGLAWTIGGLSTTWLVAVVGARGLLVIAPALLVAGAALIRLVTRKDLDERRAPPKGTGLLENWRRGFRAVTSTPLLRFVLVLGVLALVSEQLMDYQLMASAKDAHQSPADLTAFFGRFYGVTSGLGMLLSLALAGRLMARLGAPRVLLFAPAALVLMFGAALVPLLAVVVTQRGADRVLKGAFWTSALDQLQTPLRPVDRAQSRALVRGVVAPLAYGLVSLGLAALPHAFDLRWLAAANVLAGLATLLFATRMRRVYVSALHRAVDERTLVLDEGETGESPGVVDLEAGRALEAELTSGDTSRALVAAELLAAAGGVEAREVLEAHGLAHPDAEVRAIAVEGLSRERTADSARRLAKCLADEAPRVRLEAVQALRRIGRREPEVREALAARAANPDEGVRAWCVIALAEHDDPRGAAPLAVLAPLYGSPSAAARLAALAATPASLAGDGNLHAELALLLTHDDAETRVGAVSVIARLRIRQLLPRLAPLFDDPQTAPFVFEQLGAWSDAALQSAWAAPAPAAVPQPAAPVSLKESSILFSASHLGRGAHADEAARARGVGSAGLLRRAAVPKSIVLPLLQRDIARAYGVAAIQARLEAEPASPERDFFAHELAVEARALRERLLSLLALADKRGVIRSVDVALRAGAQQSHVAELLELTVKEPLASQLVPLFETLAPKVRADVGYQLEVLQRPPPRDVIDAVLKHGGSHLCGCAMVAWGPRIKAFSRARWEVEAPVIPLYERLRFLRGVPLFVELSGDDLRQIASILANVALGKGEVVFKQGEPGDELFVIMRGKVSIRDGARELAALGPRDFFGELAVLDREPRSADAVCLEDCELLRLKGADMHELLTRRPGIQNQLISALVKRVREQGKRVP